MKLNKKLFWIGTVVALLTFAVSFILVSNNSNEDYLINYWINVSLAVFGSSVVMILTSIFGYFVERKKYEIQYAAFFRDFLLRIVRFVAMYNNHNVCPEEIYNTAGSIHSLYDSFAYVQDFEIYGYFFKKGKRRVTMEELHNKVYEYANELSRIQMMAQKAYLNNQTNFSFQTTITVNQLDIDKGLVDKLLK